ncbi:MAG: FAD/NAD(P)-binding protein [Dehalococcoidia bacterium]|nr:FAD/NAD(P)-binding protein [Dehalococcoidia bacterium]
MITNPFVPFPATLKSAIELTSDVKLFTLELDNPADEFDYKPGQFAFVSAYGVGESPFGLTSVPYRKEGLQFAVRKVGTVTTALHQLEPGAKTGVRGPFGNFFPLDDYRGKNIIIIGGGIGFAPLRPVIRTVLDNRSDYGDVIIINGARTPGDLCFSPEFDEWSRCPCTNLVLTVDAADVSWNGRVALVPAVVADLKPSPQNSVAIICGPPIMIRFTLTEMKKLGFEDDQIVTTLEGKMKCGLGKCFRCNVGEKYVCRDGPVFTFAQISRFIEQF